jgi:hypothetical protein
MILLLLSTIIYLLKRESKKNKAVELSRLYESKSGGILRCPAQELLVGTTSKAGPQPV